MNSAVPEVRKNLKKHTIRGFCQRNMGANKKREVDKAKVSEQQNKVILDYKPSIQSISMSS